MLMQNWQMWKKTVFIDADGWDEREYTDSGISSFTLGGQNMILRQANHISFFTNSIGNIVRWAVSSTLRPCDRKRFATLSMLSATWGQLTKRKFEHVKP